MRRHLSALLIAAAIVCAIILGYANVGRLLVGEDIWQRLTADDFKNHVVPSEEAGAGLGNRSVLKAVVDDDQNVGMRRLASSTADEGSREGNLLRLRGIGEDNRMLQRECRVFKVLRYDHKITELIPDYIGDIGGVNRYVLRGSTAYVGNLKVGGAHNLIPRLSEIKESMPQFQRQPRPHCAFSQLILPDHRLRGFTGILHSLQRGIQSTFNQPNTDCSDNQCGDCDHQHQQSIQSHILLGLQIGLCALLCALGIRATANGFNRGAVGDERRLSFVTASIGLVLVGGLITSLGLSAAILLLT